MSVTTSGIVHQELLAASRPQSGLPVGYLHCVGAQAGDASGGENRITWTLPLSFALSPVITSFRLSGGSTARNVNFELTTGITQGSTSEKLVETMQGFAPVGFTSNGRVFQWRPFIYLPNETAQITHTLIIRCENVNGETLAGFGRFLLFDRDDVTTGPQGALPLFLMH